MTNRSIELKLLGVVFHIHCGCENLNRWMVEKFSPHIRSVDNPIESTPHCILVIASLRGGYEFRSAGRTAFVSSSVVPEAFNDFVVIYLNSILSDTLLIHGSCVCFDEEATVLVGSSKSGKTTLSIALHAVGHHKLCDDITPFHLNDGQIDPFNYYPTLRSSTRELFDRETVIDSIQSRTSRISLRRAIFLEPSRDENIQMSHARRAYTSNWEPMYKFVYGDVLSSRRHAVDSTMSPGEPDFRCEPMLSAQLTKIELARRLLRFSYPAAHPLDIVLSKLAICLENVDGYVLRPGRLEQTINIIRALEH